MPTEWFGVAIDASDIFLKEYKMTNLKLKSLKAQPLFVDFHNIRKISSPSDEAENRVVYAGHMPISAIIDFPTDENVRGYLVDAEGKSRRTPTRVHMQFVKH